MYCKPLTKQELQDLGILNIYKKDDKWVVLRYWHIGGKKDKEYYEIPESLAKRDHVYRPAKYYPKISFCAGQRHYSIALSRLLYVWFKGDITEPGYVVDHIDNNPFNNELDNLQLLTIQDNLAKRFKDNPDAWVNQWGSK